MKVISPLFSDMSGKLGGAVGAKARGGVMYLRALVIPTNPSTLLQTAIRSAVQSASAIWQSVLTELQQSNWFDIATGTQTGKSLFAKVNQARIYAANAGRITDEAGTEAVFEPPYFADAPTDGITVPFFLNTPPVIDDSGNTLDIGEASEGHWNINATGAAEAGVYVYLSGPQSPSRNARQHPYQLVRAYAIGSDGDITFTPINLATLGIPTVAGKIYYVKVYAQDDKGRTSLPVEYRVTCVA